MTNRPETTQRNDVLVVVRLPHQLRDALKKCADREDRSLASIVRVAAREYLAHAEDK